MKDFQITCAFHSVLFLTKIDNKLEKKVGKNSEETTAFQVAIKIITRHDMQCS